jgi:peroxin-19
MDASANMAQDPLAAMFAQLESSMGIDDPSIQDTLEAMMGQLMSKELLYEPIKDLNDKVCTSERAKARSKLRQYPAYLAEHGSAIPPDDFKRYTKQSSLVAEISAEFQKPSYSDDDPAQRAKIVQLMQEVGSLRQARPFRCSWADAKLRRAAQGTDIRSRASC